MSGIRRPVEYFRMGFYVAFCTGTVWLITNTPVGETFLRWRRYIVHQPDFSSKDYNNHLSTEILMDAKKNSQKYKDSE